MPAPSSLRRRWLGIAFAALLSTSCPATAARIAIIIDDIGYHLGTGLRAARFPAQLTLAVLPHSPNGASLAQEGHSHGKEIMLHAPMSSLQDLPLDTGALTDQMDRSTFTATLAANLAAVPYISGVNNHMGSRLTQATEPMDWLMLTLKQRRLYFVDSRTSAASRAFDIARDHRLPSLQRDVFLDNQRDITYISAQFARLITIAKANGQALAIGHPYTETLDVLARELVSLQQHGVELVPVSALLAPPRPTRNEAPVIKIRHYR
ncbi:divergent polysaccharide deacetylase family protein [Exilibacterium tricleocarpae]|uniref:divergent polysaccharide deacetylase family protein n=1 Tax=Exilibacterium tricleocarpae TaxID=2591008 RepID=UPI0015D3827F|nr:divergent polysaccharide deacetylase family protein [Exilibacterium tricleocarpae]